MSSHRATIDTAGEVGYNEAADEEGSGEVLDKGYYDSLRY